MKRTTLLAAVIATMVAGGALAQDNTTDGFQTTEGTNQKGLPECSDSVALGEYVLERWGGNGMALTGISSRSVGDPTAQATTEAELRAQRDTSVAACETVGHAMTEETEKKLDESRNSFGALLSQLCPTCNFGGYLGSGNAQHRQQVEAMTAWYQAQIRRCQQYFTDQFVDTLWTLCR
ncbi:MAG: hypothetical protein OXC25_13715 [Thiotrichales bacterium]|nr:hypothetical protein [Thiotrichales bacterium]MCY4350896.1 hypothetical protein [Thiotrichales bacterium]